MKGDSQLISGSVFKSSIVTLLEEVVFKKCLWCLDDSVVITRATTSCPQQGMYHNTMIRKTAQGAEKLALENRIFCATIQIASPEVKLSKAFMGSLPSTNHQSVEM